MKYINFIRVFLAVIIVVGASLLLTQKVWVPKVVGMIIQKENPVAPVVIIPNVGKISDTSSWKTYTNEKYGFELQYPADWIIGTNSIGTFTVSNNNKLKGDLSHEATFRVVSPRDLRPTPALKEQILAYLDQKSNFIIDSYKSIREVKKDDSEGYIEYVSFIRGDDYFVITLDWAGSKQAGASLQKDYIKNITDNLEIFNQILSTFKLTK